MASFVFRPPRSLLAPTQPCGAPLTGLGLKVEIVDLNDPFWRWVENKSTKHRVPPISRRFLAGDNLGSADFLDHLRSVSRQQSILGKWHSTPLNFAGAFALSEKEASDATFMEEVSSGVRGRLLLDFYSFATRRFSSVEECWIVSTSAEQHEVSDILAHFIESKYAVTPRILNLQSVELSAPADYNSAEHAFICSASRELAEFVFYSGDALETPQRSITLRGAGEPSALSCTELSDPTDRHIRIDCIAVYPTMAQLSGIHDSIRALQQRNKYTCILFVVKQESDCAMALTFAEHCRQIGMPIAVFDGQIERWIEGRATGHATKWWFSFVKRFHEIEFSQNSDADLTFARNVHFLRTHPLSFINRFRAAAPPDSISAPSAAAPKIGKFPFSEREILRAAQFVMKGDQRCVPEFREIGAVVTIGRHAPGVEACWIQEELSLLTEATHKAIKADRYSVPELCCWHHIKFELIHPFMEGNGRTGRFLLASSLSEFLSVNAFELYTLFQENHRAYIAAVSLGIKMHSVLPLLSFVMRFRRDGTEITVLGVPPFRLTPLYVF